jgi:hypothetical protein
MFRTTMAACLAAAGLVMAAPAGAATLFDNGVTQGGWGGWNPNLIPDWDGFAAQRFELTEGATLTGVEFYVYIDDGDLPETIPGRPMSLNWRILSEDGSTLLPDVVLASEEDSDGVVNPSFIGCAFGPTCHYSNWSFSLPSVALGAGTYYLALQNYGDEHTYLATGAQHDALTYTRDGGATWGVIPNDGTTAHGWAVKINGDVGVSAAPEPGAWALMILGFGGAGAVLRRRRQPTLTIDGMVGHAAE